MIYLGRSNPKGAGSYLASHSRLKGISKISRSPTSAATASGFVSLGWAITISARRNHLSAFQTLLMGSLIYETIFGIELMGALILVIGKARDHPSICHDGQAA